MGLCRCRVESGGSYGSLQIEPFNSYAMNDVLNRLVAQAVRMAASIGKPDFLSSMLLLTVRDHSLRLRLSSNRPLLFG